MSLNETLQTRLTRQPRNVQLGALITPHSNGGSSTPIPGGYVSNPTDLSPLAGVVNTLGDLGSDYLRQKAAANKQAAQAEEDAALSKMDMDVYNIQVNPNMSASEKELRVTDVYNKYPNLPSSKKAAILSAHGADVKNTQMFMSEHKRKEDVAANQQKQRQKYADVAIAMDPYNQTLSPDDQWKLGKKYMDKANALRGFIMNAALAKDNPDLVQRLGKEGADVAEYFFPREARVAFRDKKWTDADTQAFKEHMARGLENMINPYTGNTFSATESFEMASMVIDPMMQNMLAERERVAKLNDEQQKRQNKDYIDGIVREMGSETYAMWVLTDKNPDALKTWLELTAPDKTKRDAFFTAIGNIQANKQGRLQFPKELPNDFLSMVAQDKNNPQTQVDAQSAINDRFTEADVTPANTKNYLEFLESSPNYLNNVPQGERESRYNQMKSVASTNFAMSAKSFLTQDIKLPEDASWTDKLLAGTFNTIQNIGENIGVIDKASNRRAITDMSNAYMSGLRTAGMSHQEAVDTIKEGLQKMGLDTKQFNPLTDKEVPAAVGWLTGALKSSPLTRSAGLAIEESVRAVSNKKEEAPQQPVEEKKEQPKVTVQEKPKQVSLDKIKDYNDLKGYLISAIQGGVVPLNVGNTIIDKLTSVVREIAGVKQAQADTIPYRAGNNADDYGDKPMSKVDILLDEYYKAGQKGTQTERFRAEQAVLDRVPKELDSKEIQQFYDILMSEETDMTTREERLAMNQDDRQLSNQLADRKKRKKK